MPASLHLHPLLAAAVTLLVLGAGAYLTALFAAAGRILISREGGKAWSALPLAPLRNAALHLSRETTITERPDMALWLVAPAAYATVAAGALATVPLGDHLAIADVRTGIVLFGAMEALAIVAIFLHGWSPNSHLPLLGGFRFVAVGLSYELLSMFVLIAAALPAESLRVSDVVEAQAGLWNVVKQPLGLPLWLVVTMGVTFSGPLNLADSGDLAGGTSAETSGRAHLLWQAARGGMLAVMCLMGSAVFLGGWLGPLLPGWLWIAIKTLALMMLVSWLSQRWARMPAARAVTLLWTVGLPLSFIGLLAAGLEALP